MKIIYRKRRTGKTEALIVDAHIQGGYIVCHSQEEAHRIARVANELNCDIRFPITYDELLATHYHGKGVKELYIDNADMFLQYITSPIPLKAITLTRETHDDGD